MYKVKNDLSPSFMHSIFPSMDNTNNLRNNPVFRTENIRTRYYGAETLLYPGPKTWGLVPQYIMEAPKFNEMKRKRELSKWEGCTCRMCKVYIPNLGFIQ